MQRVTDEPGQVLGAALRAQVTGPAVELVGDPVTDAVVAKFIWGVENVGGAHGIAGLRVDLGIDAAFGDFSQLIMETDQTLVGALRDDVIAILATTPIAVAAGIPADLFAELHIPVSAMLGRQGSVWGFNWWVAELTAWDEDTGEILKCPDGTDARYEIRDWFRVAEGVAHGLKGDLNDDGRVNVLDLTALELYIVGVYVSPTLTDEELFWRADVNDDGRVNVLDLTALEILILG